MQEHRKLDNLVVIVDNNGLQIDGKVEDVCSPYPIDKKFEAFNFHVINVADGNDMAQLRAAFDEAKTVQRNADCDRYENSKRQRGIFHGEPGWLAWKSSER